MSLDTETLKTLSTLAQKWKTSKSEVIRRSVRNAMEQNIIHATRLTPLEALKRIRTGAGLTKGDADKFHEEVAAERNAKVYWWENNDRSL